jgi:GT2 family glycosyltransferase
VGCRLLNVDKTIQASIVDKDSILNSIGENFFLYKIFKKNKKLNRWYYSQIGLEKPTQVDIIKGAFIFCSHKIINNLVGFDERFYFYAEETDFCLRALSNGYKIWYFPLTKIIHIGGYSTDKNLWFKFKNQSIARIQIFQKHYKGVRFYILTSLHYWGIFMRVGVYFILGLITFNIPLLKKSGYYALQLLIYPKNLFKEY